MPKGKSTDDKKFNDERLIVPCSYRKGYGADAVINFYRQADNPFCVRYSLASAFAFKGLHRPEKYLMSCSSDEDYSLIRVVQLLQKEGGKHSQHDHDDV